MRRVSSGRGGNAVVSATVIVEGEVRELVRRRGIDPIAEPEVTRLLVEDVISEYLDRSVTSSLPPLGDSGAVSRTVLDAVSGFGPLQPLLDDPTIEEVWINDPGRVFIARRGRSELTSVILTADQVADLVERMLRSTGRRIDLSTPFVDSMLPDGSRLHVVIPQITRKHMAVNIRKFMRDITSLDELVAIGSLTDQAARFLEASVVSGLNILVAGGTQAGKTTMLNALCGAIPARERVITVEEVFELQISLPDVVAMQTRQANLEGAGEIALRRLVKEALRMRPSRLIVGEVRQEECLDLLIALNSGLPGMCTLHANSAREALVKMCTLPLLAGENVSAGFVLPTVATSVDLVVHLGLDASGHRRVREIVGVPGRAEADVIETAELFAYRSGRLERGDGYPPHAGRYEIAGYDLARLLAPRGESVVAGVGV
jgi:pilus assembly protein CpaF